jgi:hypothetical protein
MAMKIIITVIIMDIITGIIIINQISFQQAQAIKKLIIFSIKAELVIIGVIIVIIQVIVMLDMEIEIMY